MELKYKSWYENTYHDEKIKIGDEVQLGNILEGHENISEIIDAECIAFTDEDGCVEVVAFKITNLKDPLLSSWIKIVDIY